MSTPNRDEIFIKAITRKRDEAVSELERFRRRMTDDDPVRALSAADNAFSVAAMFAETTRVLDAWGNYKAKPEEQTRSTFIEICKNTLQEELIFAARTTGQSTSVCATHMDRARIEAKANILHWVLGRL